jgi:hypothetical protein
MDAKDAKVAKSTDSDRMNRIERIWEPVSHCTVLNSPWADLRPN